MISGELFLSSARSQAWTRQHSFERPAVRSRLTTAITTILLTVITTGTIPAWANNAHPDFTSIVALSNCSGAVVQPEQADSNAPALILTNGHCLEGGMPKADEIIVNRPSRREFSLLNSTGQTALTTLTATAVVYATMKETDIALYRTNISYAQLRQRFGVSALSLTSTHPSKNTAIAVISGYWKTSYECTIDGFVPEIHEGPWVWRDSIRYSPECATIGGTSGSPIVDRTSGAVIGVNNTGNDDGQQCTENNPCEVSTTGQVTIRKGINYGQQTYRINDCLTKANELSLARPECLLPKPPIAR